MSKILYNDIEVWKDILGYEGLYQISNLGRVKSFVKTSDGKILKQRKPKNMYNYVVLTKKNNKKKTLKIHRLVAEAFIPNPNRLPCINHKDENKQNNNANNLEWCSFKYNNNYGTRIKRSSLKQGKPVYQFDLKGNFIKKWESISEVEKVLGYQHQGISHCCTLKVKSAYNYIWSHNDNIDIKKYVPKVKKTVLQYDKNMILIKEWESAREIERKLGIPNTNISNCCNEKIKSAAGFIWRFKERNYENIL